MTEPDGKRQTQSQDPTSPERVYLGEGGLFPEGVQRNYYALIPTDGDVDQRTLRKALVGDVLRRNGRIVDDLTLEKITDLWKQPDGGYDFLKSEYGSQVSSLPASEWDGRAQVGKPADGTIHGYSLFADMKVQQKMLGQAIAVQGPPLDTLNDKTYEQMAEVFKNMVGVAKASGNDALVKPLEAVQQALEAKDKGRVEALFRTGSSAGNATAAIFEVYKMVNENTLGTDNQGVLTQIKKLTTPEGAGKLDVIEGMGRFAKSFSVLGDATGVYMDTYKLAKGVDEKGQALTGTQRAETLISLTSNATSLTAGGAELAGALAERYGYKALQAGAGTLGAYAGAAAFGANIAAVQVAAMKVVIDGVSDMKKSIAEKDIGDLLLRNKGGKGDVLDRIAGEQAEIQGYSSKGVNAYASARRIVESVPGTKSEVWESYLKKAIEPPGLTERVFSARNQSELRSTVSQEEIERFVKGAKEARGNFIEATTRGVVNQVNTVGPYDRDADILKSVKLTSLTPETIDRKREEQKEWEKNPLNPKTEPFKPGTPFDQIRKDTDQHFKLQGRTLTQEQVDRVSAEATANFMREGGKIVGATALSSDGTKLFVVDGSGEGKLRTQIDVNAALEKDMGTIVAGMPKQIDEPVKTDQVMRREGPTLS